MQLLNTLLDILFYDCIEPLFLFIRSGLDLVFLKPLSFLHIPPAGQVVIIASLTALLAFGLRKWLHVEEKNEQFRKDFVREKKRRDTIAIVKEKEIRDAMFESADKSIDEDFNTYLAQHYFQYVLVYLLPLFLVMAWLNSNFGATVLPTAEGKAYLFLLASKPMGMQGVSVTLLFLGSYILFLILGFQLKKRISA